MLRMFTTTTLSADLTGYRYSCAADLKDLQIAIPPRSLIEDENGDLKQSLQQVTIFATDGFEASA